MLSNDRRALILRELKRHGSLNVSEFAGKVGISGMTVRRDFAALEEEGVLQRVHGGAVSVPESSGATRGRARSASRQVGSNRTAAASWPSRLQLPTVGLVMPSASYYFPSVIRGAEEAARVFGARLVLAVSNYSHTEEERQIERLLANGMDGMIVTPSLESLAGTRTLELLAGADIPIVVAERPVDDVLDEVQLESVRSDHSRGAEIAVNHLLSAGHTSIGLCVREKSPTTARVRSGFRQALRRAGMDVTPDREHVLAIGEERQASLHAYFKATVERIVAAGITAVLVLNDEDALTFVEACQELGVAIPQDLAIVAYDDEVASMGAVPLSAVSPPKFDVGYQALQMVMGRIEGTPGIVPAMQQTTLSPTLVVRESSQRSL